MTSDSRQEETQHTPPAGGEGRETSNENMATSGHVTPDIWSHPEGEGNEIIRLSYRNLSNSNNPSCAGDQSVFVFAGVMSPESLIACFP